MSNGTFTSYFLTNNVEQASELVSKLQKVGISEDDIGTVSRDSDIVLTDVPEVDLTEKSALPEALQRGALLGSGTGFFAGLLMAAFPVAGVTVGGAAVLAMTAGGGALGSWSAGMIGVSEQSPLVQKFETALDNGNTLVLLKLSQEQRQQIEYKLVNKSELTYIDYGEIR